MVVPLMKLNKKEYDKWKESVLSSDFYKDIIVKRRVTDTTKNRYVLSLATYCMYNNMSIDDLMKEADDEERANIRVKDRKISSIKVKECTGTIKAGRQGKIESFAVG